MTNVLTLHDLPKIERPRERLVAHGARNLSSVEILALILGRGVQGEPVVKLAERLLSTYGSLSGIATASLEDLQQIRGVGLAKACQLQACAEMASRMKMDNVVHDAPRKISDPQAVFQLAISHITDFHKEHYVLVSLDVRSKFLGIDTISIGILDAALVHPRETFAAAMRRHAAKVIVCHNHPSGDVNPSDDDLMVTKRLVTAGKIMGIAVIDHVIVSKDAFYSLQVEGRM
jgi:DNA repair protein RadC